jgi:hypothetical protein
MRIGEQLGGMGGLSPEKSKEPKGKETQREFRPKEKEKDKEKVESKEKEQKKEEPEKTQKEEEKGRGLVSLVQGQSGQGTGELGVAEIKGAQAVDTSMTTSRIDTINKLIVDNVDTLQVNAQGALLTLGKNAPDIPKVLQGAEIQLKLTDEGLVVQFKLAEGVSENVAARLLERGDLASLQASLADKGIHLHEMRLGNTTVNLPEAVAKAEQMAPKSIFEPESGKRDREGEQEGKKDRDQEPQE